MTSTASMYRVVSFSELQPARSGWNENTIEERTQPLIKGRYANWQWTIWGTPQIAQALQRKPGIQEAGACAMRSPSCSGPRWNRAMVKLYQTVAYLLGKPPLPMNLRLNLIPPKQGLRIKVSHESRNAVPLEFSFWYPTEIINQPSNLKSGSPALIFALSTVAYEFQHVEYATKGTAGPRHPPGPRYLKDEANSACWKLSVRLVLLADQKQSVTIERVTDDDLRQFAATYGNRVEMRTAALWGPELLKHDLGSFLARTPSASSHSSPLVISTQNYVQMNRVLTYCRGYSRYGGNIAKNPMAPTEVAKTPFWSQS
ncbi:MAG: hypothetical protein ACRETQ_12235 [Gammaproteobacteria bacterium]